MRRWCEGLEATAIIDIAGQCGQLWESDFPRYAWCQHGGVTYEARLSNPELGQYKGYPLEADEHVEGLT